MNRTGYRRNFGSGSAGPSDGPEARLSLDEQDWYSERYGKTPTLRSRVFGWFSDPWNVRKANDIAFAASVAIAVAVVVYAILR